MDNIQTVKQRFGIIGNDIQLTRALEKAVRVSPTLKGIAVGYSDNN